MTPKDFPLLFFPLFKEQFGRTLAEGPMGSHHIVLLKPVLRGFTDRL